MTDVVDRATRSRMMAGIRAKDTKPEVVLRKRLHRAGLRYSLHAADLPGKPDIVFIARRVVVFVHGCFWHRHGGCHWCSTPSSNTEFWNAKFVRNIERDAVVLTTLHSQGWRTAKVWECALRDKQLEVTATSIAAWVRYGAGNIETSIVRPRGLTLGNGLLA